MDEMEDAAKAEAEAIRQPAAYQPRSNGATPANELTRLNTTIETLYQQKRQQMTDLQARHNRERVDTENEYARMMDDLQHRASEAFRLLGERHEAERQPLQDLLNRVGAMRG